MKKQTSALAKFPKPNYLRVRIAIHRRRHSKDTAVSYTDSLNVQHRSPWARSQALAERVLRTWLQLSTGIGKVTFVAVEETIE